MKLDRTTYFLMLVVAMICLIRAITLYYWFNASEIEMPSIPSIFKGVVYPEVSFATLLVGVPSLAIVLISKLRSLHRVLFISGVLVTFGLFSIICSFYLSANVAGGGLGFLLLGTHLYSSNKPK